VSGETADYFQVIEIRENRVAKSTATPGVGQVERCFRRAGCFRLDGLEQSDYFVHAPYVIGNASDSAARRDDLVKSWSWLEWVGMIDYRKI
jgi:hypothetical protein